MSAPSKRDAGAICTGDYYDGGNAGSEVDPVGARGVARFRGFEYTRSDAGASDVLAWALVQTGSVVGDHWTDAAIRTGGGTIQRSAFRPGDRGPVCSLVSELPSRSPLSDPDKTDRREAVSVPRSRTQTLGYCSTGNANSNFRSNQAGTWVTACCTS